MKCPVLFSIACFTLLPAFPQNANVQVNRENKTIAVTAEHTMTVEPEIAILRLGYRNTSSQKETAYRDNVRAAAEILKALRDAGVRDEAISTESLRLERQEQNEQRLVKPELLQFEAYQVWNVRVAAQEAQTIIALAVRAGANEVSNPDWTVVDQVELEARAYGAALAKARKIAEQMAVGFGAQLGDLVYATNNSNPLFSRFYSSSLQTSVSEVTGGAIRKQEPVLKVFPKKVERRALVVAVFAVK